MDRAATPISSSEALPPIAWETARKLGLVGVGINFAAAVLGGVAAALGDSSSPSLDSVLDAARVVLVLVGALAAGSAVSIRPDLWRVWAIGALAAVVGIVGLPTSWDSIRFLLTVLAALALGGAALLQMSRVWRARVLSVLVLFHFSGIFMATTAPHPTPWLNDQLFNRVYNPYLQFLYMRNAYHFYSPEPGPASLIACMLRTETGEETLPDGTKRKTYAHKWIIMPTRPGDVKDPLGLAYYRRLALTEQIARARPAAILPQTFEQSELSVRRREAPIPMHPAELVTHQYRLPHPDLMRYVIPSYAQHVIRENTPDAAAAAKTTLKIYRMEHRTLPVVDFIRGGPNGKGNDPYHPATYRAHFLGEFDVYGTLVDPQERMLYWIVPVIARTGPSVDPKQKSYLDYLSAHALGVRLEDLEKPENAALTLPWDQLR